MTFIAFNPDSARHDLEGHPETAARAGAILAAFDADPRVGTWPRLTTDRLLTRQEALTVHSERAWLNLVGRDDESVWLDPDTYVVPGSVAAARGTARLGLQAVERCLRDGERGFVVARPPGHHATHDRSMGFCLLNNIALAARHARSLGAKRVLVFDHDVHHGNGTQDIFWRDADVFYQSFHLSPHYPLTGAADEVGDAEGRAFTMNAPLRVGEGEPEVRSLLNNLFLPAATDFRPDLVLVSAGFDSLEGDPLGGLRLSEAFFGELTARLARLCPRVVSFLEGGYQVDRIPAAALAVVEALDGQQPPADAPEHPASCEEAARAVHRGFWSALR